MQIKELEQSKPKSSSENETNEDEEDDEVWGRKNNIPLLDQHTELRKLAEGKSGFIVYEVAEHYYCTVSKTFSFM